MLGSIYELIATDFTPPREDYAIAVKGTKRLLMK
jgi:hypothetical protein